MAIRNFRYYLKTAFSSIARNRVMTLASFITVASCLFLFGIFLLFSDNLNFVAQQVQEQCEVKAIIEETATPQQEQAVLSAILALPGVQDATFESKEEALANYRDYLGDDASALDGLGSDFLRSSVKVSMADLTQAEAIAAQMATIQNVAEVSNRQDIINRVIRVTALIRISTLVAMLILLIVAIFIIQNTIKLSVYSREEEIHIMKFVGATDRFIRWPFVLEGVMIGLLSGIVATVIIGFGYNELIGSLSDFLDIFKLRSLIQVLPLLSAALLLFGVLMGAVGSALSLKRHLKV